VAALASARDLRAARQGGLPVARRAVVRPRAGRADRPRLPLATDPRARDLRARGARSAGLRQDARLGGPEPRALVPPLHRPAPGPRDAPQSCGVSAWPSGSSKAESRAETSAESKGAASDSDGA